MQKSVEEATASVLYYRVLNSYLLRKPDLKFDYEMLVEHYTQHPKSLRILTKCDVLRLKQVQDDILNNRYSLFSGSMDFDECNLPDFKKEKSDIKHNILCNEIVSNKQELETIINRKISHFSREYPTRFGPIDIIGYSGDTIFIIEVKTYKTDHSIVGQLMKYYIAMSLKLILRHYDDIKMISVCPGYDEASYLGLKQIGALPLIINTSTLKMNVLEEI